MADSLARRLAPNGVQKGQNQSIPGSLEEVDAHPRKRKNPKENKVILGVFVVGDIGLELPPKSPRKTMILVGEGSNAGPVAMNCRWS